MAIVKFIASGCPMNNIFPYVMNRNKTEDGILVSGIHCTPESALDEFRFVKNKFGKIDGRQYYHIVQSFSPEDKLTHETAHEIGLRFAGYFSGYQIVVATHCDRDHLHNHLVMNSVNMENGKKFHQTADDLARVKEYSNRLCREYGLSETEAKSSFGLMPKWKDLLRRKAYSVACRTSCKEDFIYEMDMHGYKVDWQEGHKYITFTTPDGHKEQYQQFENRLHPKHGYTVGEGLFSLLKSLLEAIPYEGRFTPPVEDYQIDKLTVMELEMLGIKVEPKALLQYSAYSTQDEDQGFGLFY